VRVQVRGGRDDDVLLDIRDLLQSIVDAMNRRRREKEQNEELISEWMLAATVLDRVFFVFVVVLFVAATATFIVVPLSET